MKFQPGADSGVNSFFPGKKPVHESLQQRDWKSIPLERVLAAELWLQYLLGTFI